MVEGKMTLAGGLRDTLNSCCEPIGERVGYKILTNRETAFDF
jgi:hypothetical protein